MIVESDGYSFNFTDALKAFKFDETDSTKESFHGAPMKAVDVIAEFDSAYFFIEVKEYDKPEEFKKTDPASGDKTGSDNFKCLKNRLKYKFRDTFLYRFAENKVDKPIHYICLLNFDNALNSSMCKSLRNELPVGLVSKRWKKKLTHSCQVLNITAWNRNFPNWPLKKIAVP